MTNGSRIAGFALILIAVLMAALLLYTLLPISATALAAKAEVGDTVKVLYIGTLDDGTVFDSSEMHGGEPLQFTISDGSLLPGFEQAVVGMIVNETKSVHIPFEDAYGPYYDDMITTVNWSAFQEGYAPEVGEQIQMQNSQGQTFQGIVLNTSEEGVTVDFNHPLAGKDLNFEITLVEIVNKATATVTPTPTTNTRTTPTPTPTATPTPTQRITPTPTPSSTSTSFSSSNTPWLIGGIGGGIAIVIALGFLGLNKKSGKNRVINASIRQLKSQMGKWRSEGYDVSSLEDLLK